MKKRDYFWNTAAGLFNAAEAVIMSMIVTRMTGLADAGILTIAFAVGNLMMTIGKFGVRNYQVTDIEHRFSFSTYLKTRIVTVSFMVITVVGYLVYAYICLGYDQKKIVVILAICMIYAVESLEDVIWGYYQSRNRLDAGARMFCLRWLGIFVIFPIALYFTGSLAYTLLLCLGISIILFILLLWLSYPSICSEEERCINPVISREDMKVIGRILKTVFPLFGISFLSFYENNAPKYAIDACLTDEMQACYGFVAMPVFVIGLLNNFVYQPTLVLMAMEWEQGKKRAFKKRIMRQLLIITVISAVCMAGAYLFGIPVLSLLYRTDLTGYKKELMVLLLASAFLAVSGYQSVVLTIMRCQKMLWQPHCIVSVIAVVGLKHIVAEYGTIGAAIYYLALMVMLCVMYGFILEGNFKGARNKTGKPDE